MKGDFSRNTFRPELGYRSVRWQQGRMLLDADWNEQADIVNEQLSRALQQMVGAHGGLGDSFLLSLVDAAAERPSLRLHPGSYFVDGVACELPGTDPIPLAQQPHFPGAAAHLAAALAEQASALLYLAVWERLVTAVEDPLLLETALGGADTTTRTQLVWQVRVLPLADPVDEAAAVTDAPEWQALRRPPQPALAVTRGYSLENELYRIEIHAPATNTTPATWKWSRDNGSVAFAVQPGSLAAEEGLLELALVMRPGLQEQLAVDDRVELSCAAWELDGRPGLMARVVTYLEASDDAAAQKLRLAPAAAVDETDLALLQDAGQQPRLCRWDQRPPAKETAVLPVQSGQAVILERGIMVTFPEAVYASGDYWQIPLRSEDAPGSQVTIAPGQAANRFAPLALLQRHDGEWQLTDYRRVFATLTDVFVRLAALETEVVATNTALAALHRETDVEDEEQEDALDWLKQEIVELRQAVNQLAGRADGRIVQTYRSDQDLDVGEVVASSPTKDGYIVRAGPKAAPLGVVAPRPDDFAADEYVVVLRGPALCRVRGPVASGDLLALGDTPGYLVKASLWTRWFQPEYILGRAIDIPTTADFQLIEVFVLPSMGN